MRIFNKLLGKIIKGIKLEYQLFMDNSFLLFFKINFLTLIKSNKSLHVNIHENFLAIRANSPDLKVAYESLGDEFLEVFERFPNIDDGVIIDAGGYIGTAAIKFAKIYPGVQIYTIEPSSENFSILAENIKKHSSIKPIKAALTNNSGKSFLKNRGTGQWGYTIVETPKDSVKTLKIEEVETISVEDILKIAGVGKIALMKMDIEGGEHVLLNDDVSWLDKCDILLIELHERVVPGVTKLFESATKNRNNFHLSGEKIVSVGKWLV